MKSFTKAILKATLPCAVALASVTASAGGIVTEWDFSTDATFDLGSVVWGAGGGTQSASAYELSWGDTGGHYRIGDDIDDGNRSALTVGVSGGSTHGGGPATGSVDTILDWTGFPVAPNHFGLGISFTHWNNPLPGANATLLGAIINDTLTLTPTMDEDGPVVGGPGVPAPDIAFDFKFAETVNSLPCDIASPPGSICDDIFAFELPGGGLNQSFDYDGNQYFAQVLLLNEDLNGPAPITALGSTICTLMGLSNTCLGFHTRENERTTVSFGFAISTERIPVPLPSTLALFGLGLLGLGYRAKRKAS